ncbi:hypothetical protein AVBRAN12640_07460 [Campylobacter sp. RM12640]|uniref:hypothetical protein n=1 Tax=unclassified Campylobacter TaxID=2593542 RepID=UPI00301433E2|nr:hypothetical protein [Campylobacter sp. RM12640]MBZ7989553.1 hypothetical protein [Campylobacter sp. RM12635]
MRKEKLEEKYNFVKNKNNFQTILNNINNFGKSSLALGQILLFLIIVGSAFSYGVLYVFTLKYPIELTFEQLLTFGFSNIFIIFLIILVIYMLIEVIIAFSSMEIKNKFDYLTKYFYISSALIFQLIIFLRFSLDSSKNYLTFYISMLPYALFIVATFATIKRKTKINTIRISWLFISFLYLIYLNINIFAKTGLGYYNATIMVNKNSFIKDMFDGFYDKNNKYHYKGDYIELKDVKVLSTLGDTAYVELCSENMEIGKTLEKNCKKTIKVEFIKKDIHIIRNGKKQNVANTENGSNKTNKKDKKENEQDLEKPKENKKEESATKNN